MSLNYRNIDQKSKNQIRIPSAQSSLQQAENRTSSITESHSQDFKLTSTSLKTTFDAIWSKISFWVINIPPAFALYKAFEIYTSTLEGCYDTESTCIIWAIKKILNSFIELSIVALIVLSVSILSVNNKISRFYIVAVLYFLYLINRISVGTSFHEHGIYNELVLAAIISFAFILLKSFFLYREALRKSWKLTLAVTIGVGIFIYFKLIVHSCDNWNSGLNGTRIIDSPENCHLEKIPFCFSDAANGWFDMSYWWGIDTCEGRGYETNSIAKELHGTFKLIGLPRTEWWDRLHKDSNWVHNFVLSSLVWANLPWYIEELNQEVILNKTSGKVVAEINVRRNETVVERSIQKEKESLERGDLQPLVRNVLNIFLDAVSRPQFFRVLPKTTKWIEKYYDSRESAKEAFQFFRYHSKGRFTSYNQIPMYFGTNSADDKEEGTFVTKSFIEQGFVTATSKDMCLPYHFEVQQGEYPALEFVEWDHELISLFCDPNYFDDHAHYSFVNGAYSIFRRCLYGRNAFEYVFEYGEKFWEKYRDRSKFMELAFLDAHEITGEHIRYMDESLVNFLMKLDEKGELDSTAVMIYADHGPHLNGLFHAFEFKEFTVNLKLPALFLVLPRNVADKYHESLKTNEQKLVGAYDIFNYMQELSGKEKRTPHGFNLLGNIPKNRKCDYHEEDFCDCKID